MRARKSGAKTSMDVFKGDELNKYNRNWKLNIEAIVNQEQLYLTNKNKLDRKSTSTEDIKLNGTDRTPNVKKVGNLAIGPNLSALLKKRGSITS